MNAICSFCYYADKIQAGRRSRRKNLQGQEKVSEFYFESGKIDIFLKKSEGKLRLEETFGVTVISTLFFHNEEGKFGENLSVLLNEWKGLHVEARSCYWI